MDIDKDTLVGLLQQSQIPDTERIKAVTSELQQKYYVHPISLLLLTEIALTHEDGGIRKLASGQAVRLVHKHWDKIDDAQKDLARQHLLEGTLKEPIQSNRNTNCRLLSAIAHLDLDGKKGQPLLQSVLALNSSEDVTAREVGSYIIYDLVETDPTNFEDDLYAILDLLGRNIHDPQSKAVRVNAIKTIWSLLMLIEAENTVGVQAIQRLIPPTVEMLRQAVAAEDESSYSPIFESLSLFLSYDSVFLAAHFSDLLHFMMDMATNRDLPQDARAHAIDFLSQCARFRRMKLQAMKDVPGWLMTKSMAIIAEMDPDEDGDGDDDDMEDQNNPPRSAMILVDTLSGSLPPRMVMVPLLDEFARYAVSPDPALRRAAMLALGVSAEGAPDFLATQADAFVPRIIALLCDPDVTVRSAALTGLTNLADYLADTLGKHHEGIINALLQNLEAASQTPADKRATSIIRAACIAFDSLCDGIDSKEMSRYGPRLLIPIGKFLGHDEYTVKAAAAGAIGSIAESLGRDFLPYFADVMVALSPYVLVKDSPDALALRSASCDTMGRIATAVGPESFQPYVMDLMKASEEGMALESDRLKETSFLLWSCLSKVYAEQFAPFLPAVFKVLLDTLELEEKILTLPAELTGKHETSTIIVGGKKLIIKGSSSEDADAAAGGDLHSLGMDADDSDNDDDVSELDPITGTSLEQEAALETLADVIANSCGADALAQYVSPALAKLEPLAEHSYEGVRKNAITAYWRIYARMWAVWEEQTGHKWQPGLPANPSPDAILMSIASSAAKLTMKALKDDPEPSVIYDINCTIASTLKACGPAILTAKEDMLEDMIKYTNLILKKAHPCQQDLGDEEKTKGDDGDEEGSSEMDWMVMDAALEVITGLSAALGPGFLDVWKRFEKPVMKFIGSTTDVERSTATGVIAEVIKYSADAITPYTRGLQTLLRRRISDPDSMTRSNAVYGMGQLIQNSSDTDATVPSYQELWPVLEPLMSHESVHLVDNVFGCLARMMIRSPDPAFVAEVLPKLVARLPVTSDYEENEPVFSCICKLYDQANPTAQQLTGQILPLFEQILAAPEEQLKKETRDMIKHTVHALARSQPGLFANLHNLVRLAEIS